MIDRILFLMEKYCDADPACGPSGAEHQVVGAVMSTGLVKEGKHFYFDTLSQVMGADRMGMLLLEECRVYQPDLIIYTPLGGDLGTRLNPPAWVMQKIMGEGFKVFMCLWDAPERGLQTQWLPSATLLGVDNLIPQYRNYKHLPNVMFMHSTVDPRVFYDKGFTRDIDVSFVGSVDPEGKRWPWRAQYTALLREHGVNITVAGGQRGSGRLPIEEYAKLMCRSKISLDFCQSTDGKPTMHLRSFEVPACGALLMEDHFTLLGNLLDRSGVGTAIGPYTTRYYSSPGDFILFRSDRELLEMVRYFLAHEDERAAIAKSGHEQVSRVFNALNMWGQVFERMDFDIGWLAKDKDYLRHKRVMEGI